MRNTKIALVIAVAAICTLPAMAGHHHRDRHHGNDGVRLAANIIGLVNTVLQPNVVTPPPVVVHRPPVVHCPPPPRHHRPLPPPRPRHDHHKGRHGRR